LLVPFGKFVKNPESSVMEIGIIIQFSPADGMRWHPCDKGSQFAALCRESEFGFSLKAWRRE